MIYGVLEVLHMKVNFETRKIIKYLNFQNTLTFNFRSQHSSIKYLVK